MTVKRVKPLVWFVTLNEQAATGLQDIESMSLGPLDTFDDAEIADIRERCERERGRRLVISVHRSPNAAENKQGRRKASPRWDGLKLQTGRIQIPEDSGRAQWTAVTVVIEP